MTDKLILSKKKHLSSVVYAYYILLPKVSPALHNKVLESGVINIDSGKNLSHPVEEGNLGQLDVFLVRLKSFNVSI